MFVENGKAKDINIAYIGGGSRGWAWELMSDLVMEHDLSGTVRLYDIDIEAAKKNEIIGNSMYDSINEKPLWVYKSVNSLKDALTGADFVVISILPGTFDEMESDVHAPEKYGIYQPVGDSIGLGGLIRALRTIPMYEEIGKAIGEFAPDAYVISYTNPMTVCTRTLYKVFPGIKAIGCCHEVFSTQKLLASALKDYEGIDAERNEIEVEVSGVNHFTWLTKAHYKTMDLMPLYERLVDEYWETGYLKGKDTNWMNNVFECAQKVKFDLFRRFGAIAAAGDRHLAEFCPRHWYLSNPLQVKEYKFGLTSVAWRKKDLKERLARSERLVNGTEKFKLTPSGEEGVTMIKALCGLGNLVTNGNLPNKGQMFSMKKDVVVETNALITGAGITPLVSTTPLPSGVQTMIDHISNVQEMTVEAAMTRDRELAFRAFCLDTQNTLSVDDSYKLFDEMLNNTSKYLCKEFLKK